jgi:hypothetical protein
MLPTCRQNFAQVTRTPEKVAHVCCGLSSKHTPFSGSYDETCGRTDTHVSPTRVHFIRIEQRDDDDDDDDDDDNLL